MLGRKKYEDSHLNDKWNLVKTAFDEANKQLKGIEASREKQAEPGKRKGGMREKTWTDAQLIGLQRRQRQVLDNLKEALIEITNGI